MRGRLSGAPREYEHKADEPKARRALVEVSSRMYQRGYIVARDGNVSVRIGEDRLLITPSGARKGHLSPERMVLCDLEGRPVRGERGRPSGEIDMHVTVYAHRPDVGAVVHAHPPCAVAHTIAGLGLAEPLMPEALCELGVVVTVPYTTPTTPEVGRALASVVLGHDALLLERHGTVTLGPTLDRAYDRLEVLEHTARISMFAHLLAPRGVTGLDERQRQALAVHLGCGVGA